MDDLPMRNLQGQRRGLGSNTFHNTSPYSYARVTEAEEPYYPADPPQLSDDSIPTGADYFVLLTDEDVARHPELQELNFRPLALKLKYLAPLTIWCILCFSGATSLAILGRMQPSWFHLESQYSYNIWTYSPSIIGTLSTILLRSITHSYQQIIPYVRMANVQPDSNTRKAGIPGAGLYEDIGVTFSSRDYLSINVFMATIFLAFLTPIKSEIFQLVKDKSGWRIEVSVPFCAIAMAVYLWWTATCIAVAVHLHKNKTDLKWNPSTLAAQVTLLQGSDVLDHIYDVDTEAGMARTLMRWYGDGLILRLGYWQNQRTNVIIHGVRFLPTPQQLLEQEKVVAYQKAWRRYENDEFNRPSFSEAGPGPDVDRIWNYLLHDAFLVIMTLTGVAALAAATFAWVKGDINRPFQLPSAFAWHLLLATFTFSFLPNIWVGFFNISFLAAHQYHRHMKPIQNMVKPLPTADQNRLKLRERNIQGAKAQDSVLMDYVSSDAISCIISAFGAGHYKIILGVILATFGNALQIIASRIFVYVRGENGNLSVKIVKHNFYTIFFVILIYCMSLWILRPYGSTRTCRRVYTLMDFAMLIHKSYILKCPEFWAQEVSDTEDHMKSQVVLADRIYHFGLYSGIDGHTHVGISIPEVPLAWSVDGGGNGMDENHRPERDRHENQKIDLEDLQTSTTLARAILKFGASDSSSVSFARNFFNNGPPQRGNMEGGYSNEYRSWRRRAQRMVGRGSTAD